MDSKIYWQHTHSREDRLKTESRARTEAYRATGDIDCLKGQPPDSEKAVYIISKDNFDKNCTAGSVTLVGFMLAAQRIIDQTHEVATADELKQYQIDQELHGQMIAAMNRKNSGQGSSIHITAVAPARPKGKS